VYTFKLSTWLKTGSTESRKQKRSLKQMHADLCVLGFEGSYDRVAAFARQWKVDQLDRVNAASKGTAQADWAHLVALAARWAGQRMTTGLLLEGARVWRV
jgi:hypothetical protein